jgi:peroxiredoxin Q/BCP
MAVLKKGDKAPDFSGIDQDGNQVSLSGLKGKKLILYFYPKDDTPGCTAEACNLRDNFQELTGKGFVVVGVSPDKEASHQKFISKYTLPFTLISDPGQKILKAYNAWGMKSMYGKQYEGVLRKTYVLDEQGDIMAIIEKVDTKDHTRQILEELNK